MQSFDICPEPFQDAWQLVNQGSKVGFVHGDDTLQGLHLCIVSSFAGPNWKLLIWPQTEEADSSEMFFDRMQLFGQQPRLMWRTLPHRKSAVAGFVAMPR